MKLAPASLSPGFDVLNEDCVLTTHGAVVEGGVYAIDTTAVSNGRFYKTRAIAATDYTNANGAVGAIVVVSLAATASGANGPFRRCGYCKVLVDGTTDVAVGDLLSLTGTATNLVKSADPTGTTVINNGVIGIALEARTANSVGLQLVLFNSDRLGYAYSTS